MTLEFTPADIGALLVPYFRGVRNGQLHAGRGDRLRALLFATIGILIYGIVLTKALVQVLRVPQHLIVPIIFVLCAVGSFAIAGRLFDVYVMLVFGIVGFVLRRYGYPMAPLVLGLVLGDLLEKNLRRALVLSDGDLTPFFTRPISAVVAALIFGTIGWKLYSLHRARRVTHAPSTGVT